MKSIIYLTLCLLLSANLSIGQFSIQIEAHTDLAGNNSYPEGSAIYSLAAGLGFQLNEKTKISAFYLNKKNISATGTGVAYYFRLDGTFDLRGAEFGNLHLSGAELRVSRNLFSSFGLELIGGLYQGNQETNILFVKEINGTAEIVDQFTYQKTYEKFWLPGIGINLTYDINLSNNLSLTPFVRINTLFKRDAYEIDEIIGYNLPVDISEATEVNENGRVNFATQSIEGGIRLSYKL